jgi:hypothetical protein
MEETRQYSAIKNIMRKLPVLEALTHAVKSTWHNLPFALHASWPWLLMLIPLNLYFHQSMESFDPTTVDPVQQAEMAKAMLTFYAVSAVSMVIYSSIGVTWHRYILQDEVPQGAARLRLDATVWRYVGNTLLIGLMVVFGTLPLALIAMILLNIIGAPLPLLIPIYIGLALLVALPMTYRFSLKLPAIAVGNKHFRLGDGWNLTRGNMPNLIAMGLSAGHSV